MNARTSTVILCLAVLAGCEPKYASTLPQEEPQLRKSRIEFAADAAKRTYPADLTAERTYDLRAQVGYMLNVLEIANLTDTTWSDFDVWVNKKYVIHVPKIASKSLVRLWFYAIYDQNGNHFPTDNLHKRVETIEVLKDGKLYELAPHLAD